jgi:FkbM family methyltransferase
MLLKAEYVFQPRRLVRRLLVRPRHDATALVEARLPWGRSIRVSPRDNIGPAVLTLGVYDLVVTETLWRLTESDDIAVDIGANIGCITAALAERAGEVHCFEPHPLLHAELLENIRLLESQGVAARIVAQRCALGGSTGTLPLRVPADFARHRGESTLVDSASAAEVVQVQVRTLDDVFGDRSIGVMKMDVEGFEAQVLRGAARLLSDRRLRDCVFEEHRPYPTEVSRIFESHGYTIFRLARRLMRPKLLPADSTEPRSHWEATSFLATRDAVRAQARMTGIGWMCLGWS